MNKEFVKFDKVDKMYSELPYKQLSVVCNMLTEIVEKEKAILGDYGFNELMQG